MATNYIERLKIPVAPTMGDWYATGPISLYTKGGTLLLYSYDRVVIGKRGPYIEFTENQIPKHVTLSIPEDQKYRLTDTKVYYHWYTVDGTKLYKQMKPVEYAEYRPGHWYVSPFDLYLDNEGKVPVIEPLRKKDE